jgi:hypothetical protein
MDAIKKILKKNGSNVEIWYQDNNISGYNNRNYFDSKILYIVTNQQLNLAKNKVKPDLETLHPREQIEFCLAELMELHREFETEGEINFERVLEEIGDVGAYLSGIIAWVRKDLKDESVG